MPALSVLPALHLFDPGKRLSAESPALWKFSKNSRLTKTTSDIQRSLMHDVTEQFQNVPPPSAMGARCKFNASMLSISASIQPLFRDKIHCATFEAQKVLYQLLSSEWFRPEKTVLDSRCI